MWLKSNDKTFEELTRLVSLQASRKGEIFYILRTYYIALDF